MLSDPLCEKLTDEKPYSVLPSLEVQKTIWELAEPVINRINPRLPEDSRYSCDIRIPEKIPDMLQFSHEQIRVIAESLGNEILNRQVELKDRLNEIEQLKQEITNLKVKNQELIENANSGKPANRFDYLQKRLLAFQLKRQ